MLYARAVHAKAIQLAKIALEITAAAGSGHPTSAASLAHLVTVLMYDHMRYDPDAPDARGSDRLVLSEGHACPIVYAAAADIGIRIGQGPSRRMTLEDATRLRQIDSEVDGHPNPAEGFPFFPAATGSLGQGLSIAAGLALASRLDCGDARMFCIIGDGESREGQIQEALDFILEHRAYGVCPIFNCNGYGQTGEISDLQSPDSMAARLETSGFDVRLIDGHDPTSIRSALDAHARVATTLDARPIAIVARTVKGWGSPSLQDRNLHGKAITGDALTRALEELDDTARRLDARWAVGELRIPTPRTKQAPRTVRHEDLPSFREALERYGDDGWDNADTLATRKAYGVALRALGHVDPRVVALDGDVGNSTYSELFADDPDLEGRFFECRIAEQNMMSCAVGLWKGGYVPFASTFGKFVTRAYDQIEMAMVSRAAIKMVGSHCGVSLAADGPSQMALPDVAFFRSISATRNRAGAPLCYVLQPADARAAYELTLAMARHDGPCYMRTVRPDVPILPNGDGVRFELGGHRVVRTGEDALIVASGYMVHEAVKALEILAKHGVRPTLVDLYSLPFDEEAIAELARDNNGLVLSVEDNYGGGIGSAIAEVVTERALPVRARRLHVRRVPKSGRDPDDVLAALSLSADDIARECMELAKADQR
jgi:transketolase